VVDGSGGELQSPAQQRAEMAYLRIFTTIRAVHLLQGGVCLATGVRAYRRPWLVAATLAAFAAEGGWLARRWFVRGRMDETGTRVDALLGVAGLVAIGAGTPESDLTTSLNWAMPLTVGTALCAGGTMSPRRGAVTTAALAGTYAWTVRRALAAGGGEASTAMANIASYGGFHVVARVCMRYINSSATELEEIRRESVSRGESLATERERNRQYRLLHDSALQALEGVLATWGTSDERIRSHVRRETTRLRRVLSDDVRDDATLVESLHHLVDEFDALRIELVADEIAHEPAREVADALREATREALRNVAKHAGTSRAVVRCANAPEAVEIVIRDHGCGFEQSSTLMGFGMSSSIVARLAERGGSADIWSATGRGTRVTLIGPVE
jgi:signal transduction histidine kinase